MHLRPYQESAIEAARQRIREGHRSVLVVCPTGGGKTVVASSVIQSAVLRGGRVLFLAHRRELIDQTSDKLRRFGVPHGIIMGGRARALQEPVQVASVQALARNIEVVARTTLAVVDEAHHVTEGNTYGKILAACPQAKILGLTATPWRLDGKTLDDAFLSHVIVETPRGLRDQGYLVPVCGYEYRAAKVEGVAVRAGDFAASELSEAVRDKVLYGNIVTEWREHAGNARTLVFAVSVEHSLELRDAFRAGGVAAEHLDADTPLAERADILARLRAGDVRVVCNVGVLTEGFDEPSVSCVVLARPTLSTSLYLQMVGRALRPVCLACHQAVSWGDAQCPWCQSLAVKREARIHDHAGCLAKHGHPYAVRDYDPSKPITQRRDMAVRQITNSWGDAIEPEGEGTGANAPVVRLVEAAKREAIGADSRRKSVDEVKRDRERAAGWRAKTWEEKKAMWERMVLKHGVARAKGVYAWASGFSEYVPRGWVMDAEARFLGKVLDATGQ